MCVLGVRVWGSVANEENARDGVRCFSVGRFEKHGPCGQFENHDSIFVQQKCCLVVPDARIKDLAVF
jgi:hypothetical protein